MSGIASRFRLRRQPQDTNNNNKRKDAEDAIASNENDDSHGNSRIHWKIYLKQIFRSNDFRYGVLGLLGFIFLAWGYWYILYKGWYNTDRSCRAEKFEYPSCLRFLMHQDEKLPDPFTPGDWLDWRIKYQYALLKANVPGRSTFDHGWGDYGTSGFVDLDSIEIKKIPGKGRAVLAKKLIPAGTKIWSDRYRAVFPNECTARLFFNDLDRQQKCDAMFWGYANNFYGNGLQYMIDMDGHGYINHENDKNLKTAVHHFENEMHTTSYGIFRLVPWGGYIHDEARWRARRGPGAYGLNAFRDIQPGEEITYDYGEIYQIGIYDWYSIFVANSLPFKNWNTI